MFCSARCCVLSWPIPSLPPLKTTIGRRLGGPAAGRRAVQCGARRRGAGPPVARPKGARSGGPQGRGPHGWALQWQPPLSASARRPAAPPNCVRSTHCSKGAACRGPASARPLPPAPAASHTPLLQPSHPFSPCPLPHTVWHAVGFLGDGINNAPALHAADMGISVDTGSDIAKDAAGGLALYVAALEAHSGFGWRRACWCWSTACCTAGARTATRSSERGRGGGGVVEAGRGCLAVWAPSHRTMA